MNFGTTLLAAYLSSAANAEEITSTLNKDALGLAQITHETAILKGINITPNPLNYLGRKYNLVRQHHPEYTSGLVAVAFDNKKIRCGVEDQSLAIIMPGDNGEDYYFIDNGANGSLDKFCIYLGSKKVDCTKKIPELGQTSYEFLLLSTGFIPLLTKSLNEIVDILNEE